ncbi:F-box/kelch-repeat protein SKIP11 [Hordeum vulgare]|nr:F-box/kelch-repeat protein SKIP11 [Hordeum vulgare]
MDSSTPPPPPHQRDIIEVTRVLFAPESYRWDYGTIASLNHEFNSVVRNGDIYHLRRKNGVAEHWLYLSCGNNPLGWEAYDPSTGRWIQVPNMPRAQKYGQQQIVVRTEVLVFVACGRGALRYSILTNSWTQLTDVMKTPWYLFGSASDGEKAYVVGGLDSSHTNVLSSVEMYDSELETHTWTTLPSMNRARYRCSGSFMDNKFYVIGAVSSNRGVLTCGEEYDLILQSWRVIDNMSHGLNQTLLGNPPLLAVVNNELYAADYSENNDLKKYDKLDNK